MKISDILREAWALIAPLGRHCRGAFAMDAEGEIVSAQHEGAVAWDSTGAVIKVLGYPDGPELQQALACLAIGAMRMKAGVLDINDKGTRAQLEAMWSFAIATAENVERQLAREASPA